MSSLKETLRTDLTERSAGADELRSATLRMALTAVTNEEVAGKEARELSDDEVLAVLTREAKRRREAATAYDEAERPELADRERAELVVLEGYLPAQLSDEELVGPGGRGHRRDRRRGSARHRPGDEGDPAQGRQARRRRPGLGRGPPPAQRLSCHRALVAGPAGGQVCRRRHRCHRRRPPPPVPPPRRVTAAGAATAAGAWGSRSGCSSAWASAGSRRSTTAAGRSPSRRAGAARLDHAGHHRVPDRPGRVRPPNAGPGRRWPLPTLCPFSDWFGIVGCPT